MALLNRMLSADILSYYLVEKWPISTTSHQLHMPHAIVTSILTETGLLKIGATPRHRLIDTYLPFILQTLEKSPTLHTKPLYKTVCKQGYTGDFSHFCRFIKSLRLPFDQYEWMLAILQKKIITEELKTQMSDLPVFINSTHKSAQESSDKSLRDENKQLKKDLQRKEKALAETAALLVLQKKFQAFWEEKAS
jgi:hypothetical protein